MNEEVQLKLQAYLDGELSEREAREVMNLMAQDAEAQKLLAELKLTATVLRENEPQHALTESREFYWSKIERAIAQSEPATAVGPWRAFWFSLRRGLVPMTGLALVMFLGIASLKFNSTTSDPLSHLAEVESLSEHVSSFSFRSQSENMFVVWLHENSDSQSEADRELMEFDDAILQ